MSEKPNDTPAWDDMLDRMRGLLPEKIALQQRVPLIVPAKVRDMFGDEAVRAEARRQGYQDVIYQEMMP